MKSWWRNATLALSMVLAAACVTGRENRRSLFIDQVEPHADREQVMASLSNSGWCIDEESVDGAILHWCMGEPHMRLDLTFQDRELVQASLGVPAIRGGGAPMWNGKVDPYPLEKPRAGSDGGRDVSGPLFTSLGVELRSRYGAPRVANRLVEEWTPSRAFSISLHRHRMFVVETYTFPRSVSGPTLVTSTEHAVRP
jgi:hypothetical protein